LLDENECFLGVPLRRLSLTGSCNRFTLFSTNYVEKNDSMSGIVQNNQQQLAGFASSTMSKDGRYSDRLQMKKFQCQSQR
jgi:hypothetical protein